MERIKYKGQVYQRVDSDDGEFTPDEISAIKKGIRYVSAAAESIGKAHAQFEKTSLSDAAYGDLLSYARKVTASAIRARKAIS